MIPDPPIKIGNQEGRYFTQWRFDELRGIAAYLSQHGITNFEMWYDAFEDFHKLSFVKDGIKYIIRYYKVFVLYKEGNEQDNRLYGSSGMGIVDLFAHGRYREWV